MSYSISQVAKMMGVTPSTLRYYDQEGLLPHIKRVNGMRVFEDEDFRWLRVLNCLKNTKMPIKKIRKYILNYQIENLIIVTLNNKNKVLCIKNIDFNEKRIKVSCFDVIKFVIQNGAIKFIVVHNHTGNLIEPSLEDLNYTKTLQTEAKKFNLNLIDSIILNREDYFSFFEENLL